MKCSFCGTEIVKGTGFLYVYKDGTIHNFCSRKCEANMLKLKRKPQKVKWTARYHEEKNIRMHGKEKKKTISTKKETTKKKASRAERKAKREAKKAAIAKKKKEIEKMKKSEQAKTKEVTE